MVLFFSVWLKLDMSTRRNPEISWAMQMTLCTALLSSAVKLEFHKPSHCIGHSQERNGSRIAAAFCADCFSPRHAENVALVKGWRDEDAENSEVFESFQMFYS